MVLFLDTNQCEFSLDAVRRNMHVSELWYLPSPIAESRKRKRIDEEYLDTDEDERPNARQRQAEGSYTMVEWKKGDVDVLESQDPVIVAFTEKKSEWPSYWQGVTKRRAINVPWSVASRLNEVQCYIGHVRENDGRITPI